MKAALSAALAFSCALGLSSAFWLRAGLLTRPDTIVRHEWMRTPPVVPLAPALATPLTMEELRVLALAQCSTSSPATTRPTRAP